MAEGGINSDRVGRMFDVLELLVGHREGMTVTEISRRLELPISSVHNMLQRLVASDLVVMSAGPRYSVGGRLVRLGIRVVDGLEIRSVARKPLQELARTIDDDVYLAVRLGLRVVYVDRIQGSRAISVDIRLGQDLSLHATAVGKLFSAYDERCRRRALASSLPRLTPHTITDPVKLEGELDRIKVAGYALSSEEGAMGIGGVAVPVLDISNEIVGAIHVSSLVGLLTKNRIQDIVAATRESAWVIERALGR